MRRKPLALPGPKEAPVLLVSPPVTPPWRNGTVLLARDLACGAERYRYRVLGSKGQQGLRGTATHVEPFYGATRGGLGEKLRLATRLLRPDGCRLQHFFFAPSKRTSQIARLTLALTRKRSVHTLPSLPEASVALKPLMFAERIVVMSEASALLLRSEGIDAVRVIRPGVALPDQPASRSACRDALKARGVGDLGQDPTFLYAGDLEFSGGAEHVARAAALVLKSVPSARFIFACRPKTPASRDALARVRRTLQAGAVEARTMVLGIVDDMATLMGAVDALVMPVDSLYAKVDTPYVLLEAMALGRPVIMSNLAPLSELGGLTGSRVVPVGNVRATADAIIELALDPAKVEGMGRQARSAIGLHFSIERMVQAYEALYDELI